ncbi:MAG: hypothetical protein AAFZ15_34020 [Bacteroidota bacterium]
MKQNNKIIYLISHGHTARGAFQTNLISRLSEQGFEMVVIAKKDEDGSLAKLVEKQNASIDFYDPKNSLADTQRTIFRAFVHQNIKKNPALWEKHQRRTRGQKATLKRRLLNRLYFFAGNLIRLAPPLKWIYNLVEKRLYLKPDAISLLKKHNPVTVISTRPVDNMEAEILCAATKLNIHKTMYILSWDNITAKGIFPVLADSYLTWGPIMNEELKAYYKTPEERIHTTGVTHFDVHAQVKNGTVGMGKVITDLELQPANPYLFFTMSASYFAPNEIDIIEWLAAQIEKDRFGKKMQLIIRPHMANFLERTSDVSWIDRLKKLKSKRVAIDFPIINNDLLTWYMDEDDMVKLSRLIKGSTICINSGSTISIEALAFDKPVILTTFDTEKWPEWRSAKRVIDYLHLKKLIDFNALMVAESLTDLATKIDLFLENPSLQQRERTIAIKEECFKIDGQSTERFVRHMQALIHKN